MKRARYKPKRLRDRKRGKKLRGRCRECGRRCEYGDLCRRCMPAEDVRPTMEELPEPDEKSVQMHSQMNRDEKRELARLALLRLLYLPMGDPDADPFNDENYRRLSIWCGTRLTVTTEGLEIAAEVWEEAQETYDADPDAYARRCRRTDWLIDAYDNPHYRAMSTMI